MAERLEGIVSMSLKPYFYLIIIGLLFSFSCGKNKNIPLPVEPPPTEVDEPAEEVKETTPPVVAVDEPEDLGDFDISKIKMDDVYFDFDKSDLTSQALDTLRRHVETLKANSELKVLIEGHCDERGTEEYNLGLGESRANRVREYFISSGISANRLKTISYGELRPKAMGSDESAWAQNRRAQFKLSK